MAQALPARAVIDGLGQGILIFDAQDHLVLHNAAAQAMLGYDLKLIATEGWSAAAAVFGARLNNPEQSLDTMRARALASNDAVRFTIYRGGEHLPCRACAVRDEQAGVFTMLVLETTDWSALTDLFEVYLHEVYENTESTRGHADLILNSLKKSKPNESVEQLGRRIGGFARLIQTHMHRIGRLTLMMERLGRIRTGLLAADVAAGARRIDLQDFIEDFVEGLTEERLLDPETEGHDYRQRLTISVPPHAEALASPAHLSAVLRDILRNAIMYSMVGTPIALTVHETESGVRIDLSDEGYGIRSAEADRVFSAFARARQPQIMGEFGYGLSLYLCKQEIEAMHGRLWFESEEGVGTVFSIKLPVSSGSAAG